MIYDVAIVGAGVIGSMISRELSKFDLKVCLLEKDSDVATGASRANSGIVHAGYDAEPGSLKARMNVLGNRLIGRVSEELDVPFQRIGSLVISFNEEAGGLQKLYDKGVKNGVNGLRILDREQLRQMEPNISKEAVGALYAPTAGIISPYELAIGAVENAVANGVDLKLESEVLSIEKSNADFTVVTGCERLKCRYIVNAAGVYADAISAMAGDATFSIHARKGEYQLFDKNQGDIVKRVIFQLPTKKGKGVLVTPTVDGNLLAGPNANPVDDKADTSTTSPGMEEVINSALKSVPGINARQVITSFAGLRATPSTKDFIIRESDKVKGLIQAAGIESPGLTASPAIAEYVVELLTGAGLAMNRKAEYNPERKAITRFRELDDHEKNKLIKENRAYGKIVCRCERITEAEIIESIRRPAGARTVDAVKRRTRAGMGRCQGGFCSTRIIEILSRELNIPMEDVTKMGKGSNILAGKVK